MSMHQRRAILGDTSITYTLRRSRRARHALLHVDHDGSVELVVPWHAAYAHAEQFLQEKQEWLLKRIAVGRQRRARRPARALVSGDTVPLFGEQLQLVVTVDPVRKRSRVRRQATSLHVVVPKLTQVRPALVAWYRGQARAYFSQEAAALAASLGVRVGPVRIGEHRTQWGSCGPQGQLSFNWRLLLGPREIARYVVLHEVAHIKHHNHSPAYWAVVRQLDPDYEVARAWLREYGHTLLL